MALANDIPLLRRLTREQAEEEERRYWSGKTVAERLEACAALNRRLLLMRGINVDEREADFTPLRIPRSRR
jgi:hypothetical protein